MNIALQQKCCKKIALVKSKNEVAAIICLPAILYIIQLPIYPLWQGSNGDGRHIFAEDIFFLKYPIDLC